METPSNPRLDVVDIAAVAARPGRGRGAGGRQHGLHAARPAAAGARRRPGDAVGHEGAVRAPRRAARRRVDRAIRSARRRCATGARSPARSPAASRRGSRTARWPRWGCGSSAAAPTPRRWPRARGARRRARGAAPVAAPRWPSRGRCVSFTLESAERAQAFFDACALVTEATSFGGVHSTAERRARWGTDDVPEGFIRFSAGCEDTADLRGRRGARARRDRAEPGHDERACRKGGPSTGGGDGRPGVRRPPAGAAWDRGSDDPWGREPLEFPLAPRCMSQRPCRPYARLRLFRPLPRCG